MEIYISYFYQIRNFTPDIIPLSTALWPPFWFGYSEWIDKRGVINGMSADVFKPQLEGMYCKDCDKNLDNCQFKKEYYEQLCKLDFQSIMQRFDDMGKYITQTYNIINPKICLMVYEAPNNPCSERGPLIQWFKDNGYELKEWSKYE